jgi:phage shock protein A
MAYTQAMSLVDRARTALWSNLNGIVTRLEQAGAELPALLEQMGQEINKARRELIRVMGEEKVLRERSKVRFEEAQKWQSRAELAVKAANDALARDALGQTRRLQAESTRDANSADEYGALAQSIRADVAQMEQKHRDWSSRQKTIGTRVQQSQAGGGVEALGGKSGQNPFDDFRRAEQSIQSVEDSIEAMQEVQEAILPGSHLEREFTKLEEASSSEKPESASSPSVNAPEQAQSPAGKRRVRIE